MNDIIKGVSILTTIPEKALRRLVTKELFCISDAIADSAQADKDITDIDIGIGTLSIKVEDNEAVYHFVPSEKLEDVVKQSIIYKQNLLKDELEEALVERVTKVYKEIV